MPCYFFSGRNYIRVHRGETGAGTVDPGYPMDIDVWNWPSGFATEGIDAALNSGPVDYFFSGDEYIRVHRGETGPGTVDPGYPVNIGVWGWPAGFGAKGIDAALESGSVDYFFSGNQYIRVTRGDYGPGTVDPGYPKPISVWGWPDGFGARGIDAALHSGSVDYFFSGRLYIRVHRGDTGAGTVDPGYPMDISAWGWPASFGANGIDAALFSGTDQVGGDDNGDSWGGDDDGTTDGTIDGQDEDGDSWGDDGGGTDSGGGSTGGDEGGDSWGDDGGGGDE